VHDSVCSPAGAARWQRQGPRPFFHFPQACLYICRQSCSCQKHAHCPPLGHPRCRRALQILRRSVGLHCLQGPRSVGVTRAGLSDEAIKRYRERTPLVVLQDAGGLRDDEPMVSLACVEGQPSVGNVAVRWAMRVCEKPPRKQRTAHLQIASSPCSTTVGLARAKTRQKTILALLLMRPTT
jgi:hypothetical protein